MKNGAKVRGKIQFIEMNVVASSICRTAPLPYKVVYFLDLKLSMCLVSGSRLINVLHVICMYLCL